MRGTSIGRFLALDPLGEGGMGVVYAAYDPELNRKVAIKLLHPRVGDLAASRARLLREAQAMARLTHPNVVAVYDVGTFRDDVFVAMELVDGRTLWAWLKEKPRSWREVLGVFRQAGLGLAAAHAAGLVHRDFKPANVLVRKDEVVKVSDFGLALSHSLARADIREPTDAASAAPTPGPSSSGAGTPQSSPGVGTPGYMAPEQIRGEAIDARADQYSFCVALYEALFGERPFEGKTLATAMSATGSAELGVAGLEVAGKANVPGWVVRPVLRGLSPNPSERFDSLDALLESLGAEPRSKWRQASAVAAVVAVLVAGGSGYRAVQKHNQICKGAEAKLAGIWDPPRTAMIEQAFAATGKPFARAAFVGIKSWLDTQTRSWVAMHTQACEATRLRGEQSEALLDLRMDCLRRRLDEVKALTDVFARADAQIVEKAVEAAQGVTPLQGCADVASLTAPVKPPADAAARTAVEAQRTALAQVQALRDTGKYLEALELAKRVAPEAQKLGYRPLEAEALFALGTLQSKTRDERTAEQSLEQAGWAAESGRDDELRAKIWMELLHVVGYQQAHLDQAHQLARWASATVERLDNPLPLKASLEFQLGSLALREGKYADAADHLKQSLEIRRKVLGPDHRDVANTLTALANVARERGAYEESLNYSRQSLAILERTLGPDHPLVADALTQFGNALKRAGKPNEALEAHQRALAIQEKAIGPDSPTVAAMLSNVGTDLRALNRNAEAMQLHKRALAIEEKTLPPDHIELARTLGNIANLARELEGSKAAIDYGRRALAIFERALGPDHPEVALALSNLGSELASAGDYKAALDVDMRALAIREKALGPQHPLFATTLDNIALVFDDQKKWAQALKYHQRALEIREKALGSDHPMVIRNLVTYARSYVLSGKPKPAVPLLERAIATPDKGNKGDRYLRATAQAMLARALWESGRDRNHALDMGEHAYEVLQKLGEQKSEAYRELEPWLLPKLKGGGRQGSQGM
jgi:serine/threonine protein kinase/tetratricopeptide (TPR) repeat protein